MAIGAGEALHVVDLATGTTAWATDARVSYVTPTWTPDGVFRLTSHPDFTLAAYPVGDCAGPCAPSWTTTLAGRPVGQASAAGDLVFVGTADGTVAAYPPRAPRAARPPGRSTWAARSPHRRSGTADGRVVAFGLPS